MINLPLNKLKQIAKNRSIKDYKKRKSNKNYFSEKILSFKGDAKKTWKIMKDPIGKAKMNKSSLPRKIRVKKTDIFDQEKIATEFNRFFVNVGPMLAKQIPKSKNIFQSYLVKTSATMQQKITLDK